VTFSTALLRQLEVSRLCLRVTNEDAIRDQYYDFESIFADKMAFFEIFVHKMWIVTLLFFKKKKRNLCKN
jgi:hypothetical protein